MDWGRITDKGQESNPAILTRILPQKSLEIQEGNQEGKNIKLSVCLCVCVSVCLSVCEIEIPTLTFYVPTLCDVSTYTYNINRQH